MYKLLFILFLLLNYNFGFCNKSVDELISMGVLEPNYRNNIKYKDEYINANIANIKKMQNDTLLNEKNILSKYNDLVVRGIVNGVRPLKQKPGVKSFYDYTYYILFLEVVVWIYNEVRVITARVKPIYNSYKAQLKSTEASSKQITQQIGLMMVRELKTSSLELSPKSVYSDGYAYRIGGVAANACYRAKREVSIIDVLHNVYPAIADARVVLNKHLNNTSSAPDYNLPQDLNKLENSPVSPFYGSINTNDKDNLSTAIKNIVNPKTFTMAKENSMTSATSQHASNQLRYELMVKVIHNVMLNFAKFKMASNNGNSEQYDLETRYAMSVSNNANKSTTIKNIKGNLNELNETFSNLVKLQSEQLKINLAKNSMLSVMVTQSIDALGANHD